MSGKKYWSKLVPNCTCEVVGGPDSQGLSVGFISDPAYADQPFAAVLKLDEGWSEIEVVPVPEGAPETGFLVIYGDPAVPSFSFHTTEVGAVKVSIATEAFGYTPVAIPRYMIPLEGVE